MDIIAFSPSSFTPTKLENGEVLNKLKSVTWVERYRDPGEFTIVADVSTGLKEKLAIGTFVTHSNTSEVMVVENHEIEHTSGKPREIKVTGRSMEVILEHRSVGSSKSAGSLPAITAGTPYTIAPLYTWQQAVTMINEHIGPTAGMSGNPYDVIPYIEVIEVSPATGEVITRSFQRGSVHQRLLELLAVDGLGIKTIRPGSWSPLGSVSENTAFVIHSGIDRSAELAMSFDSGDLESANYLWSIKNLKNVAHVTGRWVETLASPNVIQAYDRRIMHVDASDIDQGFEAAPTGTDLANVNLAMIQRGLDALFSQNMFTIVRAEPKKLGTKALYRTQYDVGDWVMVQGDYETAAIMQVTEHVEIIDESGMTSYPTLSVI